MATGSTQVVRVMNISQMGRGLPIMFNALPGIVGTPGPQGPPGPGAYTQLVNPFTMPPSGASVNVTVQDTSWMVGGASLYIGGAGYFTVQSVFDATHATLINSGTPGNAANGTIITAPDGISAAGGQGPQGAQGIIGPVGPQGATGPMGSGVNYRANWDPSASYAINDAVTYGGSSYVALKTSVGVIPGTDPTTWNVFAAQGATGATGSQGIPGNTGQTGATGAPGPASTAHTTTQFTQPAVNATITIAVDSTAWASAGMVVFIAGGGYYEVESIPDATHFVLSNPGWVDAAPPGTTIASGSLVSAGGVEGAPGNDGQTGPPGPQGNPGTPGARAYSITQGTFVVPVSGSYTNITVDSTAWMTVGANIYIAGAGYYQVSSIVGANAIQAINLGYQGNASPATTIASGNYVYAAGAPQTINREYYKTDFENGWPDWVLTSGQVGKAGQIDADSQGVIYLQCPAAAGSTYGLQLGGGNSAVQVGYRTAYYHARIYVQQLSNAADSFSIYFGWFDNVPGGAFQNGVFFYYNNAGSTPNNWGCYARRGGAQVFSDSGVQVQTGLWYDLEVTVDSVYATFSIARYAAGTVPTAPVMVAQIAISQCPAAGTGLGPSFGGSKLAGSSVAPYIYIDAYEHEILYKGVAKFRNPAMIGPTGKDCYTGTTANFITPTISGTVQVSVADTSFMSPGMQLYIAGAGTYQVISVSSPTQINVMNTGSTGNAAPSTLVSAGATVAVSGVPGPQGIQGPIGTTGPVGPGAWTTTTSNFIQPLVNATVNIPVINSNWMAVGQIIYIHSGGYYIVTAAPNQQNITVTNPGYTGNTIPGNTVLNNSQVSAAGIVGPPGVDPAIVGSIMQWCSNTLPQGWLLCAGGAVSRTTYNQLFAVLGTTWGAGDGSTTFNVPDLRGRTLLGAGQAPGLTNRAFATVGGEELHTLSIVEMPVHTHGVNFSDPGHNHPFSDPGHGHPQTPHNHNAYDSGHTHNITNPQGAANNAIGTGAYGASGAVATTVGYANITVYNATANIGNNTTGITIGPAGTGISISNQNTGSGASHNNMQPWLAINYIIKAAYNVPVGPSVPMADTTQPGLVIKMSGLNTDYVGGDNSLHDLGSMVRLVMPTARSYNSLGNSTFELDARNVGGGTSVNGAFALDRWQMVKAGTWAGSWIQNNAPGGVFASGTNFCVSSKFLRFTLSTQEGTLGVGDYILLTQFIEGARLRELMGGSTSVSVLVRSSVGGTTFSIALRDAAAAYSCAQLGTIATANTWTLVTLLNFPTWAAGGSFPITPGVLGYYLSVCLACGTNFVAAQANQWTAANRLAAPGQTNFAANPVNSTFDLAFISHEPGSTSSGIIDKDFDRNLEECARYYQKSCLYGTKAPDSTWQMVGSFVGGTTGRGCLTLPVRMAKTPTFKFYGNTGTLNTVYLDGAGSVALSSVAGNDTSASQITFAAAQSAAMASPILSVWEADSGW